MFEGLISKKKEKYLEEIDKLFKMPDSQEKNDKLTKLLTDFYIYCHKHNLKIQDDFFSKYSSGSFIIPSEPKIFDVDKTEVMNAAEHLKYVLKNGGGITKEEANLLLSWSVQKTREALIVDGDVEDFKKMSLAGACGFTQTYSLLPFINIGAEVTINNAENFDGSKALHSFGTVTLPIEENGRVYNEHFLLDASFRQFFTTILCNTSSFMQFGYADAGYYMVNFFGGKEFATELLENGYIHITPDNFKLYAASFVASSKIRQNNLQDIDKIFDDSNKQKYYDTLFSKQVELGIYDADRIERANKIMNFPSNERNESIKDKYLQIIEMMAKLPDTTEKAKELEEVLTRYSKYCYENNLKRFDYNVDHLMNSSYIIPSEPIIYDVDVDEVKKAADHLRDVILNGGGILEDEAEILLQYSVYKARELLAQGDYEKFRKDNLLGVCGYAQAFSLIPFIEINAPVTVNFAKDLINAKHNHAYGTVTLPIDKGGAIENERFLIDVSYRRFFSTMLCNDGCFYDSDERFKDKTGPYAGYYVTKYPEGKEFASQLLRAGYIKINPHSFRIYASGFSCESLNITNRDKVTEIINNDEMVYWNTMKNAQFESLDDLDLCPEEIDFYKKELSFPSTSMKIL